MRHNLMIAGATINRSWLSEAVGAIEAAFEGNPAGAAAAAPVVQSIQAVGAAATAALPALANVGANAALAAIPGGTAFDGLADEFIDAVIAILMTKKSAPVAQPQPAAAPGTPQAPTAAVMN